MTDSILDTTKRACDVAEDDTAFDNTILLHINSVFSKLTQLGIGPAEGFDISDRSTTWAMYLMNDRRYNLVKTYMYLNVRMLFDPPTTSYHITAMQENLKEYEWRISVLRESGDSGVWLPASTPELDGGNAVGA